MWKSGSVLVVKELLWSALLLHPSSLMERHVVVKVTRTVLVGFFLSSGSQSEDEDEDEEDELARRAFFVVAFLVGGWHGLFLPSWSLSEKRSVVLRHIEMDSGKEKNK